MVLSKANVEKALEVQKDAKDFVVGHYDNFVSPVVKGEGGDFGAPLDPSQGAEAVILRIEIAGTTEVKVMRWLSLIVATVFVFVVTIILIAAKYESDPNIVLREDNNYFLASLSIAAIFLALLLIISAVFCRRIVHARRFGLVWSWRRHKLAVCVFILLALQTANLACWLAAGAIAVSGTCMWQTRAMYALGYTQWTLWNTTFLFLIVLAHNGSLWEGKIAAAGLDSDGEEEEGDPKRTTATKKKSRRRSGGATSDEAPTDRASRKMEAGYAGVRLQKKSPPAALVMDAPWSIHVRKLIIWGCLQATLSLMYAKFKVRGYGTRCLSEAPLVCAPPSLARVGISLHLLIIWIYFLTYLYFAWRTRKSIGSRPYAEMRMARMMFGVQHQNILPVFAAFAVCSTLLLAVNLASCWTFVEYWMGVIPLQAAGTSMACTLCFYFMPKKPGNVEEVLQAWRQEFAWTAEEMPAAMRRRNAKLASSEALAQEPMFCVETAIKLLYFSKLGYNIKDRDALATAPTSVDPLALSEPIEKTPAEAAAAEEGGLEPEEEQDSGLVLAKLDVAMKLYDGLQRAEVIYDVKSDTKAVLAWGGHTLVLAFKGTSSMENAMTDLDFLKTRHLPLRTAPLTSVWGARLLEVPVRVHKGFYEAWKGGSYDQRLLKRVDDIIAELGGPDSVSVLVTGHSLGGALATLAAHAIKTKYPSLPLRVYTFGQPRVGNQAFAYEYSKMIKEHFAVIHGQDLVTRIPKGYYKRTGGRVFLDTSGDIVVRPTYLEMQLITKTPILKDHMIPNYRMALMRLIKAQFTPRRLPTGQPGARDLARTLDLNETLLGVNCSEKELDDPEVQPETLENINKHAMMQAAKSSKPRSASGSIWSCCGGDLEGKEAGGQQGAGGAEEVQRLGSSDAVPVGGASLAL